MVLRDLTPQEESWAGVADVGGKKRRVPKRDPCPEGQSSSAPSVAEKMATSAGNKKEKSILC